MLYPKSINRKDCVMGWSGGSDLMSSVISAAKNYIDDAHCRKGFYKKVIDAFEDCDWDTQNECIGEDTAFDEALYELHPTWFDEQD